MIVGMIPTFREGPLAASAIRTLLECCNVVLNFEGPIENAPLDAGARTDLMELRKNPKVIAKSGEWKNEVAKRNAMLDFTRRYDPPVWGVFLDGDEILMGAKWVPDLIWAAEQQKNEDGVSTAAIPLLIQEVDSSVGRIHRIIRLDLLERHVLSMSQMKFFTSDLVATFPVVPLWRPGMTPTEFARPPMEGEPHIHHRAYYRPPRRYDFRLHKEEGDEFQKMEREALARMGLIHPGDLA